MKYPFLFCNILLLNLFAMGQNIPESAANINTVRTIVSAILDTNSVIGVFEIPSASTQLKVLKSGKVPEQQVDFLNSLIKYDLIKMNLIRSVKGATDSVVFIRRPHLLFTSEPQSSVLSFSPFSSTVWLLILRKAKNNSPGEKDTNWINLTRSLNDTGFINSNTLFELSENTSSALCIEWTRAHPKPSDVEIVSMNTIQDFQKIINQPGNDLQRSPAYWQGIRQKNTIVLSSTYGKAVLEELCKMPD